MAGHMADHAEWVIGSCYGTVLDAFGRLHRSAGEKFGIIAILDGATDKQPEVQETRIPPAGRGRQASLRCP
jgi:hypothetical protein